MQRSESDKKMIHLSCLLLGSSAFFLLELKEEYQHLGIRVLGAKGTERDPCRYLEVKIAICSLAYADTLV